MTRSVPILTWLLEAMTGQLFGRAINVPAAKVAKECKKNLKSHVQKQLCEIVKNRNTHTHTCF